MIAAIGPRVRWQICDAASAPSLRSVVMTLPISLRVSVRARLSVQKRSIT